MVVIYPTDDGVAVIYPGSLPVQEAARKDVPAGTPYRIVEQNQIPTDRSQRALWTADFSEPDGFGIGPEAWFEEQVAAEVEA